MSASLLASYNNLDLSVLLEQYKNLPNYEAIIAAKAADSQDLENALWSIRTTANIFNAQGVILDDFGELLNEPRNGISDDDSYRGVLIAKIAQNVSQGTAEDVISIYALLSGSAYVDCKENSSGPATFSLTAVGGTGPICPIATIVQAILASKPLGVTMFLLGSVDTPPFTFLEDMDPNGAGFGNSFDSTVGGYPTDVINLIGV